MCARDFLSRVFMIAFEPDFELRFQVDRMHARIHGGYKRLNAKQIDNVSLIEH